MPPVVKRDRLHGFRFYDPCPSFSLRQLPEDARIIIPPDGGFWVVDGLTGIRYRRVTMADLSDNHVTWNTRGKAAGTEDNDE